MPTKPRKYGVPDADNPEWTREKFARSKRLADIPELRALINKGRGPQKTPTRELISIRVPGEVVAAMRASGPGWQTRASEALRQAFLERKKISAS
jgi:uncharacterized protein (DUF4415 family)